eukprot:scaffold2558_cov172-Amphora_coffeaeformis.AAC.12
MGRPNAMRLVSAYKLQNGEKVLTDRSYNSHFVYKPGQHWQIPGMERQKATVRACHEIVNSRFKEWECMRDIWRHPTKSHHKVFWAIANIMQLRIVHEGIAFWVDYNDNVGG